jgi:hypothetical protein
MRLAEVFCLFMRTSRLLILVFLAETEIHYNKDDSKTESQKNINRHDPIPMPNICNLPDPPWFSFQTTFKLLPHSLLILRTCGQLFTAQECQLSM